MVEVKLRGRNLKLSLQDLTDLQIEGVEWETKSGDYFVVIDGKEIPAKRALYSILRKKGIDLTLLDFTTQDAVRIFRKLGVPIVVKSKKQNLLQFAGAIKEGEKLDAVEDKKNAYEA